MAVSNGILAGKVAVVTGGGGNIGRAICQVFAKNGASLAVLSQNMDKSKATVDSIEAPGYHHPFQADVSSPEEVSRVYKEVLDTFDDTPTILVNSAGIANDKVITKMDPQVFDRVIDVNLKGTFLMTQAAVRAMKQQKVKEGSIVNVSSLIWKVGKIGCSHYGASKAGMIGFTKSAALEFAHSGIRCNAVVPAYIETDMLRNNIPEEIMEEQLKQIPMRRLGKPHEVADACLFLASHHSSYITATTIEISGGIFP